MSEVRLEFKRDDPNFFVGGVYYVRVSTGKTVKDECQYKIRYQQVAGR